MLDVCRNYEPGSLVAFMGDHRSLVISYLRIKGKHRNILSHSAVRSRELCIVDFLTCVGSLRDVAHDPLRSVSVRSTELRGSSDSELPLQWTELSSPGRLRVVGNHADGVRGTDRSVRGAQIRSVRESELDVLVRTDLQHDGRGQAALGALPHGSTAQPLSRRRAGSRRGHDIPAGK